MRYFPQIVVPLLLFLIAILLGAILYLQYTRAPNEPVADSDNNQGRYTPWDPIETPDFSDEDGDMGGSPEHGRRERDSGVVEVEPHVTQEPARVPPVNELKPDLQAIETAEAKAVREKADAKARLEAVLARGAVLEQEQGGEKLGARVLWIVPELQRLGVVTPDCFDDFYCGPWDGRAFKFERYELEEWLQQVGPGVLGRRQSPSPRHWLLVGRVSYLGNAAALEAAWRDIARPPAVVSAMNQRVVVNKHGWFAFLFDRDLFVEDTSYSVRAPGWMLSNVEKRSPELPEHEDKVKRASASNLRLSLEMEPATSLHLRLECAPVIEESRRARAWLEVFKPDDPSGQDWAEPGLFIEADLARSGKLTFVVPVPSSFGSAGIRFGVIGNGWSAGPPRTIDSDQCASLMPVSPTHRIEMKSSIQLQRASTMLVTGQCRDHKLQPLQQPVRVEGKQSGSRTWTGNGEFATWIELVQGNWQEKLIVTRLEGSPLEFAVDYDVKRSGNVALAEGGIAPVGPWVITFERSSEVASSFYFYFPSDIELEELRSIRAYPLARDWRVTFQPVEGRPGFYLARAVGPSIVSPLRHWLAVKSKTAEFSARLEPLADAESRLPESDRKQDRSGRVLPVYELRRQ